MGFNQEFQLFLIVSDQRHIPETIPRLTVKSLKSGPGIERVHHNINAV